MATLFVIAALRHTETREVSHLSTAPDGTVDPEIGLLLLLRRVGLVFAATLFRGTAVRIFLRHGMLFLDLMIQLRFSEMILGESRARSW